ncbi:hypothetical protein ACTFIU_004860 [Dictyostelium citrinum]
MIKNIITSTLKRPTQYGKIFNNFQGKNIKENVISFSTQPLKKENPIFISLKESKTNISINNPLRIGNKLNYSTDNKNKPTDTILKDSIFEKEKRNQKPFNSEKSNFILNNTISTIILIVAFYYLGKSAVEKIKENNSRLYNDITNEINESNKTLKELLKEMHETNQLTIEQNNHQILIQNKRVMASIVLTFLSLIFFIIDFKKKYM